MSAKPDRQIDTEGHTGVDSLHERVTDDPELVAHGGTANNSTNTLAAAVGDGAKVEAALRQSIGLSVEGKADIGLAVARV